MILFRVQQVQLSLASLHYLYRHDSRVKCLAQACPLLLKRTFRSNISMHNVHSSRYFIQIIKITFLINFSFPRIHRPVTISAQKHNTKAPKTYFERVNRDVPLRLTGKSTGSYE